MSTLRYGRRSKQGSRERQLMLVRGLAAAIAIVVFDQLGKAAVRGCFAGPAAGEQTLPLTRAAEKLDMVAGRFSISGAAKATFAENMRKARPR